MPHRRPANIASRAGRRRQQANADVVERQWAVTNTDGRPGLGVEYRPLGGPLPAAHQTQGGGRWATLRRRVTRSPSGSKSITTLSSWANSPPPSATPPPPPP